MTAAAAGSAPRRRRQWIAAAALLAVIAGFAICESLGWPFLATPIQHRLSTMLDRDLRFGDGTDPADAPNRSLQVRFVGSLSLKATRLEVSAPRWSSAPHMLSGRDIELDLRYIDLWRAYRGQPLRIRRLTAGALDAHLERLADGRVSWQFGAVADPVTARDEPLALPLMDDLRVDSGTLDYRDLPAGIDVDVRWSMREHATAPAGDPPAAGLAVAAADDQANTMKIKATGRYRHFALKLDLVAAGLLPWSVADALAVPLKMHLNATVGRANLVFNGSAADVAHLSRLSGRFTLHGPSLAAVGDPIGVTLPTTSAFHTDGVIVKQGSTWRVVIDDATVGASRLNGAFSYESGRRVPLLSGRLGGTRLMLVDLGPALGTPSKAPAAVVPSAGASASIPTSTPRSTSKSITPPASKKSTVPTKGKSRVLPDRPFDLAALRAMDANVLIDISDVDLNTALLEPLRPLHVRLTLAGGILTLHDLDARTAAGQLTGDLRLDGRGSTALWNADLKWDRLRLERWIHQARADGAPPFVSGRLNGRATLEGQGHSTAEILASLKGHARAELHDGAVSHLAVEFAGLDLAQGLGMMLKGDDVLPVQCGVADLVAEGGVFRPRVMVIDTSDSAIWVDGSLSLATEAMDLHAVVMPKDFSPMSLRTPLRVRGTFADPEVSLEKGPIGLKLASSFLLALVNPIAGLIPLIDPGDADEARRGAAGCQRLVQQSAAR
jgi:AsmA family protein